MARSTYYYMRKPKKVDARESQLVQAIDEIRQVKPQYTHKYGYRRITAKLKDDGFVVNHKHVLRIMEEHGWLSTYNNRRKRKYNSYKGTVGHVAKNLINRRFDTDRPYQKLVADVSEFRYGQQSTNERIYLEPIMDLFSGEILAFNISDHPTVEFAMAPLREALRKIPPLAYRTTVHTDQGFQYQHRSWQQELKKHHVFQSMSRKATCLDNAAMESFFSVMKAEMMDYRHETKSELESSMREWIEFYNNTRVKTKLKGKSPVQYRELALQQAA